MSSEAILPSYISRRTDASGLNSKDKRYLLQIDKVLSTFDSLDEWADYIACLSKLQKALQVSEELHTVSWIPESAQIANKLSLCLSSQLPSGVHQKALTIYETIIKQLKLDVFNRQLNIWLPVILPVFSYASLSIKPLIISIFNLIIDCTSSLRAISKPFVLSLLPGLEDENSEVFNDVLNVLDKFKLKLNDDSIFWQTIFMCIISNPDKRLGALRWCTRNLPVLKSTQQLSQQESSKGSSLSNEAKSCFSPEAGLIIHAFAVSISGTNDIVVIRGFFDLLLSHLPLSSDIFDSIIPPKDKQLLIMASVEVTLKKDMSLNRRVWNYLLGPEGEDSDRSKYFEQYALSELCSGLLTKVEGSIQNKIETFRISLYLIMDKWEISNLVTGRLFSPLLTICFDNKDNGDLITSAQAFFDAIESSYIWKDIIHMLLNDEKLDLIQFIFKTFNFNDDEMIAVHVPLALLVLLSTPVNRDRIEVAKILLNLISNLGELSVDGNVDYSNEQVLEKIQNYYDTKLSSTTLVSPFDSSLIPDLLVYAAQRLYLKHFKSELSYSICMIMCHLLEITLNKNWKDGSLLDAILDIPTAKDNFLVALGITKLLPYMNFPTQYQRDKVLKVTLSNLWYSLISSTPAYYQVESVKAIYDLQVIFLSYEVEAGVFQLMKKQTVLNRERAFSTIWTHSSLINESDLILVKPLQLLIDDLGSQNDDIVNAFIRNVIKSGFANRLLRLLTDPLLEFEFFRSDRYELTYEDDLGQFSYFARGIGKVIKTNEKLLKEVFNNELVVMDSTSKIRVVESNDWRLSSYKSLMLSMIDKFFNLKVPESIFADESTSSEFNASIGAFIDILLHLVTGNEIDFSEKFQKLLTVCLYYVELDYKSEMLELVIAKLLKCILRFLEISEEAKVNLNLLQVEDGEDDPLLVKLIFVGIEKAQTSVLLQNWISLLIRSLYFYKESVFRVLLTLSYTLNRKITRLYYLLLGNESKNDITEIDTALNYLLSGLEDLLCISHGYLITSSIRNNNNTNVNNEAGFFGNVMQGVFQIESPANRSSKQNKVNSILVSFNDATKLCFELWDWADNKPKLQLKTVNDRSLAYIANKIKFKTRKLLETLMELEMQEVIECLIQDDSSLTANVKLLNILEGGRSQVTLPHIFDSIKSRCYPQILDESNRSSLYTGLTDKELSRFLVAYFHSIDTDTVLDIWNIIIQFLRDTLNYSNHFRAILPDCVRLVKIIALKVNLSKLAEQKKNKRDLSDILVKLLNSMLINSELSTSSEQSNGDLDKNDIILDDLQVEVSGALTFVLEDLELIISDHEQATSAINMVISNLINLQIKGKKICEISSNTITLIELIGKNLPTKSWKSLVIDLFMNNSFFEQSLDDVTRWNGVLSLYISGEKDKMGDMITRITPALVTSTSNIFIWNDGSENEIKISTIKRLTYLILIQPKDYFLSVLNDLFDRIKQSLNNPSPSKYRIAIAILLRAITLKFSDLHLLPHWTFITYELVAIFEIVLTRTVRELSGLSPEDTDLVLHGCKLLDQLLLLGYDEFNLNEWLFVTNRLEVIEGANNGTIFSMIDEISKQYDLTYNKDLPIRPEHPHENLTPILHGIKTIDNITRLRLFFDSLCLINYERMYGLYKLDYEAFDKDVLNDILL